MGQALAGDSGRERASVGGLAAIAPPRKRKLWHLLGAAAVVGALGYLIVMAVGATGAYYLTVAEAQHTGTGLVGRPVRVQGVVEGATVQWEPRTMMLRFFMHDAADPARRLEVRYRGARPDGVDDGRTVIAEGRLMPGASAIEATTLMVQCPSRYDPEAPSGNGTGR
ncbi:MAG: cytochrome c maturation protein CcmE [Limnochordaceae bacterium]|nr:cytochrome c maturation protein CcmE [Limnochordaceae bacterium]